MNSTWSASKNGVGIRLHTWQSGGYANSSFVFGFLQSPQFLPYYAISREFNPDLICSSYSRGIILAISAEYIIITEKWGKDDQGNPIYDSWIEPFQGDFNYNPVTDRMALAGNRHFGGLCCCFFDGHAKWLKPSQILSSAQLTGCSLVHNYPLVSDGMCDKFTAGCTNLSPDNVCNSFTY